jgi:hypothetical protein
MNWRRYFLAFAVTSALTLVADVVLNAIIFRDAYRKAAPWLLPAEELNHRVPLGWTGLLIVVAAFGFLLVRGGRVGLGPGLQFGAVLAFASLAGIAGFASMVPWPMELLLAIAVQQVVNGLLLGITFGVVYRPASRLHIHPSAAG